MQPNWENLGSGNGGQNRGRPPTGPNLTQLHQNASYGYLPNRGQVGASRVFPPSNRQPTAHLETSRALQRWENQDPSVEPANAQPRLMGYPQRGLSQTDSTQLSDPRNNYDHSLSLGFDISGVPPVQNSNAYSSNQGSQSFQWTMGDFSGPASVPAPTGNQAQPDMVHAPNTVVIPRVVNTNHDGEAEPKRKRPRARSISLDDLSPDHHLYDFFNYPEYKPPTSAKGTAMGIRSLDHHLDSELNNSYASYLFQSDPIKYWILRDVAEKVPTKIREKEIAYYKQLGIEDPGDGSTELESERRKIIDPAGEASNSNEVNFKGSSKPKEKRARTEKSSIPKGRRNWNDKFRNKFPNDPLPSSKPNWRPTVHVLLHAGKSNEGPQDFNSRILNALKRCNDPQFLSLLIQKIESCRDSQHCMAYESESTEQSEVFQAGSFDSHSHHGALSEGVSTDASIHPRRVSRNPSVRSSHSYGPGPSRKQSNTHSTSQNITDYMPTPLQTNFQGFNFSNSPARTSASGSAHFLSPRQGQSGGLHGDGHASDDISSYLSSQDQDHSYSHPGTTVPETTDLLPPPIFTGSVADDVPMVYPYAEDIDTEDIKPS